MVATLNSSNKRISAASFFGGDKVEKYRLELISEGRIPGTKLNATSEERRQAFNLYRKNKIEFKNFVEKVLQKQVSVQKIKTGGIKRLPPGKVGGALARISPQQDTPKSSFGILKVLDSILATLKNQFKFDKKKSDSDRKEEESKKRSKREGALEAVKKISGKIIDKVVAPFKSIIDRIWNFIFYTLLGRAFTKLMDWLGDPKNAQKVSVLGRFLKDWWPALLGLYFMPFKGFMVRTLARIAWFSARFALFNPVGLALTAATIGGAVKIKESERMKPIVKKQQKEIDKTLASKEAPWYQKLGAFFANESLNAPGGPKNPMGVSAPGNMYSSGGLINSNTGTKVSGAGRDTQLTALMPGEIVMNRAAVKGIGADKLLALNAQYGGSNANRPKYSSNIQFAADGGMIGAGKFAGTSTFGELPLIKAANSAGIKGMELASFLSQMSHETGGFKWNEEFGGGSDSYSGGRRFKGRGYVQLTHDYNYRKYGSKLGIDLEKNPDLASSGDVAAKIAVMYWKDTVRPIVGNNWNDPFLASKAINNPSARGPGQINGYDDRVSKFNEYKNKLKSGNLGGSKPKPKPTSPKKPGFLQNLAQNFGNFLFNNQPAYAKKIGGGLIKENTGMNIPGATADRQRIDVQPGEYVLPKDTVSDLGVSLIDKLVAMTDGNSTAAKIGKRSGRYMPGPLSRAGRGGMMTLPPITQSAGGSMGAPASGTSIPSFSAVSPSGGAERSMNASIYGIVG